MVRALIATVGGTPQPLIESIARHQPEFVCFVCSQESLDKIAEIKIALKAKGCLDFKDHKILIRDINDLTLCYQDTLNAWQEARDRDIAPGETLVDYTGGTKTMSVALGLVALTEGVSFSYVGGTQRAKEGLGIVLDGSEQIHTGASPWAIFAVREKRRIAEAFNHCRFETAIALITAVLESPASEAIKAELRILAAFCEAYSLWEKFDLKIASRKLKPAIEQMTAFLQLSPAPGYIEFLEQANRNLEWLREVSAESEEFKKPSDKMVIDLVANAERRAAEGKYDDAVARLYRALEMSGQVALRDLDINDAGNVDPTVIPENLQTEYQQKYKTNGKLKLPSYAVFRLLNERQHPRGIAYFQADPPMDKLLSARNASILAHGMQPIKQEAYVSLRDKLFLFLQQPVLPVFPKL
jgi:CRISPR-associated protein (TIGR02710 family)